MLILTVKLILQLSLFGALTSPRHIWSYPSLTASAGRYKEPLQQARLL